jgi:hypothetical protein
MQDCVKHRTRLLVLCACLVALPAAAEMNAVSGQLRLQTDLPRANTQGPLAQVNRLQDGTLAEPHSATMLQAELRAAGNHWRATATLQQSVLQGRGQTDSAWINELVATHDVGGWQLSAGKQIVSWDVGYAFRPNDVVQQETRRTLFSNTLEGRPLLMAEYLDADSAWSLVRVNPGKPGTQTGADEPAWAARLYQRQGAVDWHGFARYGAHSGTSVGAAAAWVAGDALELHASARFMRHAQRHQFDPAATDLAFADPWQVTQASATQALLGGTWTHPNQLSVLMEAWWDGAALSNAQWRDWQARNQRLASLSAQGLPASALAGNLAWQAQALGWPGSLHRSNLYARLSWAHEVWHPTLDVLYHPADGGRTWTVSLLWKGDRVQAQAGVRVNRGPTDSVIRQLPTRGQVYFSGIWSF